MGRAMLRQVPLCTWRTIAIDGIDFWLWQDTDGGGLHLARSLGDPPADVTHVWGWSQAGDRLARLRVDLDLGDGTEPGVIGAILDTEPGAEGVEVDVDDAVGQIWHPRDGRVRVDPRHDAFQGSRLVRTYVVHIDQEASDGTIVRSPLEFLALMDSVTS